MKTNDYILAAARPSEVHPDTKFTEAVMDQIATKKPKRLVALFHRKPALALLLIVAMIALASGTAYAVSYLWPKLVPNVTAPQPSASGRSSVIVTNCDKVDSAKRYELKQGAPISVDKINDAVKAQCELTTVSDWATKTYPPVLQPDLKPDSTPGSTRHYITIQPAMFAVQLVSSTKDSLTIIDHPALASRELPITADTKIVVNGQYGNPSQLLPGDTFAYVAEDTITVKNEATCTADNCHADVISSSEKILAVIKLTYSLDVYRAISSLTELPVCAGNPNDECPDASSIDLYERLSDALGTNRADIAGKVISYTDQTILLTTTSGRQVTVHTPWNLISSFNETKSSDYGLSIAPGDTLQVSYIQNAGVTNDSEIPWKSVTWVRLLVEMNEKGGPVHKY